MSSTKPLSLSVSLWIATTSSVGNAAAIHRRWVVPNLVQFEAEGAGFDHLDEREVRGVALAEKPEIYREALGRLQHPAQVPRAWRAGSVAAAGPVPPPSIVVTPL